MSFGSVEGLKRLKRGCILLFILVITFITTGCSQSPNSKIEKKDQNVVTLEKVLKNTFTSPNSRLSELVNDPNNLSTIDEDGQKNPEYPTELDIYLEELYKDHFTSEMYEEYIGKYVFDYLADEDKKLKIKDLLIEQSNTHKNIYDFTANVQYQNGEAKPEIYKVTGEANFTQQATIKKIQINSDDGLGMEIKK